MKRFMSCAIMALAILAMSSCSEESKIQQDSPVLTAPAMEDGYFTATFFPSASGVDTRAIVNGNSTAVQSLLCIIYRKDADTGEYVYREESEVLKYVGAEGNIAPQTYEWPLSQPVSFTLPEGDYKAVFVANVQSSLFEGQRDTESQLVDLLTNYKNTGFSLARINMPQMGPAAYNAYNMPYLAVVDFSNVNSSPRVVLQRVVSESQYTRNLANEHDLLNNLVSNLVKQIRSTELTTEIVRGILRTNLLTFLFPGEAGTVLDNLLSPITKLVDSIVNLILGDILEALDQLLLDELTKSLDETLFGGAGENITGGVLPKALLDPWSWAYSQNLRTMQVKVESMPQSIDFNRVCRSYYENKIFELPLEEYDDVHKMHYTRLRSFNGKLKAVQVDIKDEGGLLLGTLLNASDASLLNGLLINIHTPLQYTQGTNLQYKTSYDLLNLSLISSEPTDDPVQIKLKLNEVINVDGLLTKLLGDNFVTGLLGGVIGGVDVLIKGLNDFLLSDAGLLNIHLPNLGIGNIVLDGQWDATYVSDGTVLAR